MTMLIYISTNNYKSFPFSLTTLIFVITYVYMSQTITLYPVNMQMLCDKQKENKQKETYLCTSLLSVEKLSLPKTTIWENIRA